MKVRKKRKSNLHATTSLYAFTKQNHCKL